MCTNFIHSNASHSSWNNINLLIIPHTWCKRFNTGHTVHTTGKNNGFPILDILGYLKNTHKNPKFGRVRQIPIWELVWELPDWDNGRYFFLCTIKRAWRVTELIPHLGQVYAQGDPFQVVFRSPLVWEIPGQILLTWTAQTALHTFSSRNHCDNICRRTVHYA